MNDNLPDEDAIWKGVQQGDEAYFELLYNSFFKPLYSYGRKICSNSDVLEDAIHDLFLDIWRYHATLSHTTSIRFYLYRSLRRKIVKNENKDLEASVFEGREEALIIERYFSHGADPVKNERNDDRAALLKQKLKQLPARQYQSLILRFYDDFSYGEIGNLLGVNEQSARNLVQRGLQHLRSLTKIIVLAALADMFLSS